MNADLLITIEHILILTSQGLFLGVVWVAVQLIKSKARFVHQLTIKIMEVT